LDFEGLLFYDDAYTNYYRNFVTGVVGELPVGKNYNLSMLWESGNALVSHAEATTCTYNNENCYQARAVPVIFSQSAITGYTTGGMNLTV